MDTPLIPLLVDLVHAFKGVVVEQSEKRLEKLLSDSILLWRLLKLLFKILQKLLKFFCGFSILDFLSLYAFENAAELHECSCETHSVSYFIQFRKRKDETMNCCRKRSLFNSTALDFNLNQLRYIDKS